MSSPPPNRTTTVHVTKSTSLTSPPSGPQTPGMVRRDAIVGHSGVSLCASRMTAAPRSASAVHHHGAQDTVVYAVSGSGGALVSDGGRTRVALEPGDYALIPAGVEHQEVNDGDEEIVWSIVRSGSSPVVVNLSGWGGEEV
ncbi:RmlC-like cupin domain-containing protein [Nemania sp. NC0429]|nr:RmlC-like cupin domain-containing protein [Nemania sp. NC0429]